MQPTQPPSNEVFIAFLAFIFIYAYPAVCIYRIACKAGAENPWFAFVPIASVWLLCELAGQSSWYVLASFIPYVGGIIVLWLMLGLPESLAVDTADKYLICIPGINLFYMGWLAFRTEPQKPRSLI